MPDLTVDQSMRLAIQHHRAGRLAEAEAIYRQVLIQNPDAPDALHLLGMIAFQCGHADAAVDLISRAIVVLPTFAEYHIHLGNILCAGHKFEDAAAAYSRAVQLKPDDAGLHVMLANVFVDQGNFSAAAAAALKAIELNPTLADAHYTLGNAERNLGNLIRAIIAYQQVIRLKPDHAEAHCNMGAALYARADFDAAIASFSRAIELKSDYAEAINNLANALAKRNQFEQAIFNYRRAIELKPDWVDLHFNLANALRDQGMFDEAIAAYQQALKLKPDDAWAHNNLADVLSTIGSFDAAIAAYQQALRLAPDDAWMHNNFAVMLNKIGKLDAAIASARRAIELDPNLAEAYGVLASAYKDQGQAQQAVQWYRKSVSVKPGSAVLHSNLCLSLHYDPDSTPASILAEHRNWSAQHELPLADQILVHHNDRSPNRRLKIGYVSPDLKDHPVGRFLLPLLSSHDRAQFETFCYSDTARQDGVTQLIKENSDHWFFGLNRSDEQVAEQIRRDEIDILIDLAAHTGNNRLLVFARKPAPVQATWLGSPATTGLASMDYRLTDPYLDPPGQSEQFNTEQLIRVPHCTWCFLPPSPSPNVNSLPALTNGYITFACFNNFNKVNSSVLNLWLKILSAIPESRLILYCLGGSSQSNVRQMFESQGVSSTRLEFAAKVPLIEYYERFHKVDLCLDPFPFPGHTTTFDNLWMGVPLITLAGQTAVARGGVSILSNLGLTEFIAHTPEQYLSIAKMMSQNLPHLAQIRASLRQTMQASPLMDSRQFARDMEAAYRQMWIAWCKTQTEHSESISKRIL